MLYKENIELFHGAGRPDHVQSRPRCRQESTDYGKRHLPVCQRVGLCQWNHPSRRWGIYRNVENMRFLNKGSFYEKCKLALCRL